MGIQVLPRDHEKGISKVHTQDVVVWHDFTHVEIEAAPWVCNVPSPSTPPWKKSNLVFSKADTKASVQSFCSILKYSPAQRLVSLVCVSSCSPFQAPSWSLCVELHGHGQHGCQGHMERTGECTMRVCVTSERESLVLFESTPSPLGLAAAKPTWSCAAT